MIPTIVPDQPRDWWRRAFLACCADAERLAARLDRVHAVVENWRDAASDEHPLEGELRMVLDEIDAAWREVP
jgi:hypothetical protein